MSNPLQLPVLIIQLAHFQKVQHVEQFHPENQQMYAARAALNGQKRDQDRVPKTDRTGSDVKVRRDQQRSGEQPASREHLEHPRDEENEKKDSLLYGHEEQHIIDKKI